MTGKTGLTYEEAVASEEQALVKVREVRALPVADDSNHPIRTLGAPGIQGVWHQRVETDERRESKFRLWRSLRL